MSIKDEDGDTKSSSVTHTMLIGDDLVREVRWFPRSGGAYRWSKTGDRWVYLGKARSLDYAESLAQKDMYRRHSQK